MVPNVARISHATLKDDKGNSFEQDGTGDGSDEETDGGPLDG